MINQDERLIEDIPGRGRRIDLVIRSIRTFCIRITVLQKLMLIIGSYLIFQGLIFINTSSDDTETRWFAIGTLIVSFCLAFVCYDVVKNICRRLFVVAENMERNIENSAQLTNFHQLNQPLPVPNNNYEQNSIALVQEEKECYVTEGNDEKTQNNNIPS